MNMHAVGSLPRNDEALQRLYWACRSNSGFPGDIPDESHGPPSTTAILDALGLIISSPEERASESLQSRTHGVLPSNWASYAIPSQHQHQKIAPLTRDSSTLDEYLPSPTHSSFNRKAHDISSQSSSNIALNSFEQ
jgi:hypothetical protein